MSGGLLDSSASGILVGNCSFWIGTFWIVTFGWTFSKDAIVFFHTVTRSPVVALFQNVSVTFVPFALDAPPELEPEVPQAASPVTADSAIAAAAIARLLRIGHLLGGLARGRWHGAASSAASRAFRKF